MTKRGRPEIAAAGWAKGRYDVFRLKCCGTKFECQILYPGQALFPNRSSSENDHLFFFSCRNNGGTARGSIAALLPKPFSKYKGGDLFPCELILMWGVNISTDNKLQFVYSKWKGGDTIKNNNYSTIHVAMQQLTDRRQFVSSMFEEIVTVVNADEINVRYLNQISGPTHCTFPIEFSLTERDGKQYLSSKLHPDIWLPKPWDNRMLRNHPIIKVQSPLRLSHIKTSNNTNQAAKSIGLAKLTQYNKNNSNICGVNVFSVRTYRLDNNIGNDDLVWVPMPTDGTEGLSVDFALVTKAQKKAYDQHLELHGGSKKIDEFINDFQEMVRENDPNGSFIRCLRLRLGEEYSLNDNMARCLSFRAVVVRRDREVEIVLDNLHNTKKVSIDGRQYWIAVRDRNVNDYQLETGHCIFILAPWKYKRQLELAQLTLLRKTYNGRGLNRGRMSQSGGMVMIGYRQSSQASANAAEPQNSINYHYWNESQTNTSLLPFTNEITNAMSKEATDMQTCNGMLNIALLRKALQKYRGYYIDSWEICPYSILSYPFEKANTERLEGYSNQEHVDDDYTDEDSGELMQDYIDGEDCAPIIKKYYAEFRKIYPKIPRNRFPLPTTCCNIFLEEVPGITHIQYFVVTEMMVCGDLSSDALADDIEQISESFYGMLSGHLTSCSVWINKTEGTATTLCPKLKSCCNLAWGNSGGWGYYNRVGEDREQAIKRAIRRRVDRGQDPGSLPRVNMDNYIQRNDNGTFELLFE